MSQATQHRFQLYGWILFVLSSLFYIATSIKAGDLVGLAGGVLFLLACLVFLVPLVVQLAPNAAATAVNSLSRLGKCFRYRRDSFRAANWRSPAPGAPTIPPVPAHLLEQNQRHSVRSELRFFASIR